MKIVPLYPTKNHVLVTAQILSEPLTDGGDIEASIQFVNGNSAVEFDFSVFSRTLSETDSGTVDHDIADLNAEREAVDALFKMVASFRSQFHSAADRVEALLESLR